MFRPTVAIIRFITDFKKEVIYLGGGIDKEISCINFVLMSGVVTVYSTITIS